LAWQSGSWICVCNLFAADYLFMGSTYYVPGRHNVATLGQTVIFKMMSKMAATTRDFKKFISVF